MHAAIQLNSDATITYVSKHHSDTYSSKTLYTAYKIGFGLKHVIRIDLANCAFDDIPAVVDFTDRHGLLPAFDDNINFHIFNYMTHGFDNISAD